MNIKNNITLTVDFDNKYLAKDGKFKQRTKYFLIGNLNIVIFPMKEKPRKAVLKVSIAQKQNPFLRCLNNEKAGRGLIKRYKESLRKFKIDYPKVKIPTINLRNEVNEMEGKMISAIIKANRTKKFCGEDIFEIRVLKDK